MATRKVDESYEDYRTRNSRMMREYNRTPNGKRAIRASKLKRNFGITIGDYEAKLIEQGGRCAICAGPPTGRWPNLHVDHSHITDEVRGLLCHHCNIALGLAEDDPRLLRRMAGYLEQYESYPGNE